MTCRRALIPIFATTWLGACSIPIADLISPPEETAASRRYEALAQAGAPGVIASVEQEDARFAAFLRLLERDGVGTWVSADNVSLSLLGGFLVGTRGLGGDMMSADIGEVQAAIMFDFPGYYPRFQSFLDGDNQIVIRSFVCEIRSRGARQVDLGPFTASTRLMEESCTSTDTSFVNLYWVDLQSDEIRQSRQWASPTLGPLAIRQIPR